MSQLINSKEGLKDNQDFKLRKRDRKDIEFEENQVQFIPVKLQNADQYYQHPRLDSQKDIQFCACDLGLKNTSLRKKNPRKLKKKQQLNIHSLERNLSENDHKSDVTRKTKNAKSLNSGHYNTIPDNYSVFRSSGNNYRNCNSKPSKIVTKALKSILKKKEHNSPLEVSKDDVPALSTLEVDVIQEMEMKEPTSILKEKENNSPVEISRDNVLTLSTSEEDFKEKVKIKEPKSILKKNDINPPLEISKSNVPALSVSEVDFIEEMKKKFGGYTPKMKDQEIEHIKDEFRPVYSSGSGDEKICNLTIKMKSPYRHVHFQKTQK